MEINLSSITLRPFKLSDVDDVMVWVGDDEVTRYIRWNTCSSKEETLTFISDYLMPYPWRRSICIDDHSVGAISIVRQEGDHSCRAFFGYAVARKYWGHGIATKAVRMALPQVFQDWPDVVRLEAMVDVDNKASQRVLEKAGFLQEGMLRKYMYFKGSLIDVYIYSFLSTDVLPVDL